MNIDLCKDCLYYERCSVSTSSYDFEDKLKERIYNLFVEGWDCFIETR